MSKIMPIKNLAIFSLAGALVGASTVHAHTGVRDPANEGASSWNAFTLTHGCGGDSGLSYPVLGQSAVFPFGATAKWYKINADGTDGPLLATGGDGAGTIDAPAPSPGINLSVAGIDDGGAIFKTSEEEVDALGNVIALDWKDGVMAPNLYALMPFRITAPKIKDNCAKTLKVRIAVANWCDFHKNEANDKDGPYSAPKHFRKRIPMVVGYTPPGGTAKPQINVPGAPFYEYMDEGNGDNNRADWWFTGADKTGSKLFVDKELVEDTYWTTLTVNNTPEDIAKCTGTKYDVAVQPGGQEIDTYLPYSPFTADEGPY